MDQDLVLKLDLLGFHGFEADQKTWFDKFKGAFYKVQF
jgi:hypothetical protein